MTGPVIRGRAGRTPLPQNKRPGAEGFPPVPGRGFISDQLINYFSAGTRYSDTKWSAWF